MASAVAALKNWNPHVLDVSLGCDPELFAMQADKVVPAWEWLPEKPKYTGFCYYDGFQAEFSPRPDTCLAWLVDRTRELLFQTHKALLHKYPDAHLTIKSLVEVPEDILRDGKPEHIALGCNPSLNAYNLFGRLSGNGRDIKLRAAGGHMHFGHRDAITSENADTVVKSLDAILGIALVGMFGNLDDPKRRIYYGLPGEYRIPKWGLEYRTPSNAWLCHPAIMHLTFTLGRLAFIAVQDGAYQGWNFDQDAVVNAIRFNEVDAARNMIAANRENYAALLYAYYATDHGQMRTLHDPTIPALCPDEIVDISLETMLRGVEWAVEDPTNLVKNWRLNSDWGTHSVSPNCQWSTAACWIRSNPGAKV